MSKLHIYHRAEKLRHSNLYKTEKKKKTPLSRGTATSVSPGDSGVYALGLISFAVYFIIIF